MKIPYYVITSLFNSSFRHDVIGDVVINTKIIHCVSAHCIQLSARYCVFIECCLNKGKIDAQYEIL